MLSKEDMIAIVKRRLENGVNEALDAPGAEAVAKFLVDTCMVTEKTLIQDMPKAQARSDG